MLHLDVMDGHFVPNISIGIPVISSIRKTTDMTLDCHLMISNPEKYVPQFAKAGADIITFHTECDSPIEETIDRILANGVKASLTVKPKTPVEDIFPYLDKLSMVLVMTVEPGFGGQSFMPYSLDKVRRLKAMIERINPNCIIEIDGGISADNAAEVFGAGVDVVVAGSAVFCAEDPEAEIVKILEA